MSLQTFLTVAEIQNRVREWRLKGDKIAFVPTMGALHAGHIKLVEQAKNYCERVVVSIFVNPIQFGPNEDFSRYPRTLAADIEKLETASCDAVFAPNAIVMYPLGFQTAVVNKEISKGLCGQFRPGHFEGVLTVVLKLLNIVQPDAALFGKKDYQQWRLIERMALDLNLPSQILGLETLREPDGLAMSSRNRYLSGDQRAKATLIYHGLRDAKASYEGGVRERKAIISKFYERISLCPDMRVQYAELVNPKDLSPCVDHCGDDPLAMIVAVLYGDVRLIDNIEMGVSANG